VSTMPSYTQYDVNPTSNICVNPKCPGESYPHFRGFGKPARRNCPNCGQPMRRIQNEPRGTYHPPRR